VDVQKYFIQYSVNKNPQYCHILNPVDSLYTFKYGADRSSQANSHHLVRKCEISVLTRRVCRDIVPCSLVEVSMTLHGATSQKAATIIARKWSVFYGNRKFITMFTKGLRWTVF